MTEAAVLAVAVVLVLLGRKLTLWWCDLFWGVNRQYMEG